MFRSFGESSTLTSLLPFKVKFPLTIKFSELFTLISSPVGSVTLPLQVMVFPEIEQILPTSSFKSSSSLGKSNRSA